METIRAYKWRFFGIFVRFPLLLYMLTNQVSFFPTMKTALELSGFESSCKRCVDLSGIYLQAFARRAKRKAFKLQKGSKAKSRPHAASEIYFAGPLFHLSLPQQGLVFNSRVFCRFFYLLCSEAMAASAATAAVEFFFTI
jgi:hypothetical protein